MSTPRLSWDIFCRVIDNFGDVGVCWRLARDLASRGQRVRLWLDDASALAWMAPGGAAGVEVCPWPAGEMEAAPGDVVIEAFGCELPGFFLRRMAARATPPTWINLEYLSAESYVERSHGLRSPQFSGPGAGLEKWFFYPGFTPRTGGLIREPALMRDQENFDRPAWLRSLGLALAPDERIVTLFCYDNPALPHLLHDLAQSPCLLLVTPGLARRQVQGLLGSGLRQGFLRAHLLEPCSQPDFDSLLWASDLNLVRGEDSFVRAQWAGQPFAWQIYPQHDDAHAAKLDAFLDFYLAGCPAEPAAAMRGFWHAWNGLKVWPAQGFELGPMLEEHRAQSRRWRQQLLDQVDLSSQLLGFLAKTR